MTVFGHPLSITVVLQLVTSAIILGLYALSQSMQEQKAKQQSDRNMVFLVAFLVKHHPSIHSFDEFDVAIRGKGAKASSIDRFFAGSVRTFLETGALPGLDPGEEAVASLFGHFVSMFYVAILALPSSIGMLLYRDLNDYQTIHTALRKNLISRMMVVLSVNVFLGFLLAELLLQHHPILCAILLLNPFFVVLQCVIGFTRTTKEQQTWKEYWSDRLMEIMATASRDDNHDLFNRALILKNDVDSQPDLPIPGNFGLYTTVYTVVQAVILFFSRTLHLS